MNKEEAKKQIYQALEIKAREDSHIIGSPYVSWVETADKIDAIIDSLTIDHPKVKLPREVGEELDEYKRGFEHDIDVLDLLADVNMGLSELLKTNKWLYNSDGDRSDHANSLIDAYRYGWEAEPEAKWYVQTPKEWWEQPDAPEYMSLDQLGVVSGIGSKKLADKFTRAELKNYHFDSDIFTLVPLEEEK